MSFKELADLDLSGKTVVIRVDFNCPVKLVDDEYRLTDKSRIDDHLKNTIVPLLARKEPPRNIVLLSHQGRRGQKDFLTLRHHFEHCRSELNTSPEYRKHRIKMFYKWEEFDDDDVIRMGENAVADPSIIDRITNLKDNTVLLLENVRFSPAEDSDDLSSFSRAPLIQMLKRLDNAVFSLDGFSVAHRAQASVIGLKNLGPVYAGPVLMREIDQLSKALQSPEEPMVLVVGGGKVDDSLQSADRFLSDGRAHKVLTGGLVGMAFLAAQGVQLNQSTLSNLRRSTRDFDQTLRRCRTLLDAYNRDPGKRAIELPSDLAYATNVRRFNLPLDGKRSPRGVNEDLGDIGVQTIGRYVGHISNARTIIMNGPLGKYEEHAMALGTEEILRYTALLARDSNAHALIGGGDTIAALENVANASAVKQCSSGKAFLEVLASGNVESLVGIQVIERAGRIERLRSADRMSK